MNWNWIQPDRCIHRNSSSSSSTPSPCGGNGGPNQSMSMKNVNLLLTSSSVGKPAFPQRDLVEHTRRTCKSAMNRITARPVDWEYVINVHFGIIGPSAEHQTYFEAGAQMYIPMRLNSRTGEMSWWIIYSKSTFCGSYVRLGRTFLCSVGKRPNIKLDDWIRIPMATTNSKIVSFMKKLSIIDRVVANSQVAISKVNIHI